MLRWFSDHRHGKPPEPSSYIWEIIWTSRSLPQKPSPSNERNGPTLTIPWRQKKTTDPSNSCHQTLIRSLQPISHLKLTSRFSPKDRPGQPPSLPHSIDPSPGSILLHTPRSGSGPTLALLSIGTTRNHQSPAAISSFLDLGFLLRTTSPLFFIPNCKHSLSPTAHQSG